MFMCLCNVYMHQLLRPVPRSDILGAFNAKVSYTHINLVSHDWNMLAIHPGSLFKTCAHLILVQLFCLSYIVLGCRQ